MKPQNIILEEVRARRSDYKDIDDKIVELHGQRLSNTNIAKHLGVSVGTVGVHMRVIGIEPHYPPHERSMTANNMRQCILCLEWKLPSEFYRSLSHNGKFYLKNNCKACSNKVGYKKAISKIEDKTAFYKARYEREKQYNTAERQRFARIKNLYKLSRDQYFEFLALQVQQCKICKKVLDEKRANIDHDHSCCPGAESCGKCIRGILCEKCNWLLGMASDSVEVLKAAVMYLEGYGNAS